MCKAKEVTYKSLDFILTISNLGKLVKFYTNKIKALSMLMLRR